MIGPNSELPMSKRCSGLIVKAYKTIGDRSRCEDVIKIQAMRKKTDFVGLFDGHSGVEAANYAKEHLCKVMQEEEDIYSCDPVKVSNAIESAFVKTHESMWEVRDKWKETIEGEPSYSGTTVACALFKFDRVHIANVGDSKIVLATRNPNYGDFDEPEVLARELSKTHRPDDVEEKQRIENLGGSVYVKDSGIARIFWQGTTLQSKILPRPNLSRSLGDLWSCTESKEYIMSPIPHTFTHFVTDDDLFYVIASDGVWDVMEPQEVVEIIYEICRGPTTRSDMANKKRLISKALQTVVHRAYHAWHKKHYLADNISCIIIYYYKECAN